MNKKVEVCYLDGLRKIKNDDAGAVFEIFKKSFGYSEDSLIKEDFSKYLAPFINKENHYAYIYSLDNVEIGIVLALETPNLITGSCLYVDTFAILPEYQHCGYGKRMMEMFSAKMRIKGYDGIQLNTSKGKNAYEFYKKIGFDDQGEFVRMWKDLHSHNSKQKRYKRRLEKDIAEDVLSRMETLKKDGLSDQEVMELLKRELETRLRK